MKRDPLDLDWWEHPNGGIDWALLQFWLMLAMLAVGAGIAVIQELSS